ncbi:hypothetical protein CCACVL1_21168 [Corchorus capsularis]|uniref:Uncharacterized protein n=1 Tax=Corchorus capsularis TaxID=210143 RepID=A0A1R3H7S4_COCAP|nr:hypothetical protein CCACVL1_21168 [Corchorus capsularis]
MASVSHPSLSQSLSSISHFASVSRLSLGNGE